MKGLAAASVAVLARASAMHAADWPQWRGLSGSGVADDRDVVLEWSPATNIAWTLATGAASGTDA